MDIATGHVYFDGLDLVDGTPVLDIKPYVPFCDAPPPHEAVFAPGELSCDGVGGDVDDGDDDGGSMMMWWW